MNKKYLPAPHKPVVYITVLYSVTSTQQILFPVTIFNIIPPRVHKAQFRDNEKNTGHNMFLADNIDSRCSERKLIQSYFPAITLLTPFMDAC